MPTPAQIEAAARALMRGNTEHDDYSEPQPWHYHDAQAALSAAEKESDLIAMLRNLNPDHRLHIFSQFCTHCGSNDPHCQCWNDE